MKDSVCIMILAAGKGMRMKSETPKVFQLVAGLPILGHIISSAKQSCASQILVVLAPGANLSLLPENLRDVDCSFQKNQNGTGGAVIQTIDAVEADAFLVLYGDTPLVTSETLNSVISGFQNTKSDLAVLAIDVPGDSAFGRLLLDENGHVKKISEACEKLDNCTTLCNVGILIKKTVAEKLLPLINENPIKHELFFTDIVELAYSNGYKTNCILTPKEEMYGINTMSDLSKVEGIFQNRIRQKFMADGVKLAAPETVFFSYDTKIGHDVVINPYVIFGPGVEVKPYTEINSFSYIEGAVIDAAKVGPFSRLRPGAKIEPGAKIGNFVEIKNSTINENSKVNHLSYIGDSELGRDVNIGAGTITCNYDGFKKYKTKIEDNVFIGSNSCLVAPVKVSDSAVVGAGSVVTQDVEANAICVCRSKQKNIRDAAIKFRGKRKKCVE